jgi:hypothetical protein
MTKSILDQKTPQNLNSTTMMGRSLIFQRTIGSRHLKKSNQRIDGSKYFKPVKELSVFHDTTTNFFLVFLFKNYCQL